MINLKASLMGIAAAVWLMAMSGCSSVHSTHLAYVTTGTGIFAFRVDNASGAPTAVFSAPFIVGQSPSGIVISPSNGLAYVSNQGENTISELKIDTNSGSLTEVLPRTSAGISPAAMVMDQGGGFLYVANLRSNDVSAFSVGSDGSLKLVSTAPIGSSPTALALSSSGNLLFVAVPNFSSVYAFTVSSGTLTAAPNSPFQVANGVGSVGINPAGTLLYVPNPTADTISGFSIQSSGALSSLPSSPYGNTTTGTTGDTLSTPVANAVDPTGNYLYVANFASTTISQFTVSATGDLTALTTTTASAGTNPEFLTFDPNNRFLYVGNAGSSSITEFLLNSDGTLSSSNTIQVGTVPRGLALTR